MDIDALLTEISPDEPSGGNLEHDADFATFEKKLEGTPEDYFSNRPAQPPNWPEVRDDAARLLARTHDLRLALALIRALIHTEGLVGLCDGLSLLRGFVERYWDSVHPQLDPTEDHDPTARVNVICTLVDFEAVLKPVTLAPLVQSQLGHFCLRDVHIATGKMSVSDASEPTVQLATIQAAFTDAAVADLKALHEGVGASLKHLAAIETGVTAQVGVNDAPNLSALRDFLQEISAFLGEQLARLGVDEETAAGVGESEADALRPAGSAAGSQRKPGVFNSRQEVLHALEAICEYYARNEPSSPVPLLLQRARKLASKDFIEIIRDMAPDSLAHIQLIAGSDAPSGST